MRSGFVLRQVASGMCEPQVCVFVTAAIFIQAYLV